MVTRRKSVYRQIKAVADTKGKKKGGWKYETKNEVKVMDADIKKV